MPHFFWNTCYATKSFFTADHLMGAVTERAQIMFLSERLSETWSEFIMHSRGTQDTCWALWFCVIFSWRSPFLCRQIWDLKLLYVATAECLQLRGDHSIAEKLFILILFREKQYKLEQFKFGSNTHCNIFQRLGCLAYFCYISFLLIFIIPIALFPGKKLRKSLWQKHT